MSYVELMRDVWLSPDESVHHGEQCHQCGKVLTERREFECYCGGACWHLNNLGAIKKVIQAQTKALGDKKAAFVEVSCLGYVDDVTPSTLARYERLLCGDS